MYNRCMKCKVFYRYFRRRIAVKQKAFEGRLERKRIERQIKESQIPYSHCKNCGTELQGVYCHNCGQYAKDLKQSFGSYIMEYLSNTYNLDGRIFQTIWLLFRKPGFLTKEFLQGKNQFLCTPSETEYVPASCCNDGLCLFHFPSQLQYASRFYRGI